MNLMGSFEQWNIKFAEYLKLTPEELADRKSSKKQAAETDWVVFYESLAHWVSSIQQAMKIIGSPLKEDSTSDKEAANM
jgi:hypothetical protein